MIVKSVSSDQSEILDWISALHCGGGFECDLTYGNGKFYERIARPKFAFDIDPQFDFVVRSCSTSTTLPSGSVGSVVFDPPFLTYIRDGRVGNGGMVMAKRFAGYWRYSELEDHYRGTLAECERIIKTGGVLVFKCQDIIHNHKMHCTHAKVIEWAEATGFRLVDLFVLAAKNRMPSPNRSGAQKHARIFHSYFLVFRRT